KINFLKSAGDQLNTWSALPRTEQQARLVAWCQTQPIVTTAGISPEADNVYVVFTDNDPTVILNNRIVTVKKNLAKPLTLTRS
ncbi:hypothetical protein ABTM60_20435, partial [Acinetobacter baumannii]